MDSLQTHVPQRVFRLLQNQKYHLVGRHTAVKRCRWFYEALVHDRSCYKQKFYGVKSHQCLQMTPTAFYCTMRCRFCWRAQSGDLGLRWDETQLPPWDHPEDVIEGCVTEQMKILSGYKGNPKVNPEKYREALTPKHAAISLTGEPTLYSPLGELIPGFHRRGFTTFLVSNGTVPENLARLGAEPTQLYITVSAFDEKTFNTVCRPQIPDAWKKLNETLALLPSFTCPTVVRITLARHLNLKQPERYAKLLEAANPTYIEPKAYMHVGFSRLRLGFKNMPTHREITAFSNRLAKEMSYNLLDEATESRVLLLSRLEHPITF